MKHTHTFLILWIISLFFLINCVKKEEMLGTQIVTAKAGFKMETLAFSSKRLNLIKDPLTINVKFNQEITTIFNITSSSGATKKYQQTGKEINQIWRGGHDDLQFFKTGDTCFVELSFYGIEEKIQDTLILEKAFDFKDKNVVNFSNDFETYGKWSEGDNKISTLEDQSINPIQGKKYLTLEGIAGENSVYVGGLWLGDLRDNPMKLMSGNNISENPTDIWFNIYIALQSTKQGGKAKAIIDFPMITQGGPFDPSKY